MTCSELKSVGLEMHNVGNDVAGILHLHHLN
jgi:hypothetical protein